jgi:NADH-quinone oxidoreductase subunit L
MADGTTMTDGTTTLQALFALFPKDDATLLALIVFLPLLGAFVNGVFGKRLGREAVTLMGLASIAGSFLLSVAGFFMLKELQTGGEGEAVQAGRLLWKGWEWTHLTLSGPGGASGGEIPISIGLSLDALSGTMALVVTGVGFLIHLYSTKYMEEDPSYHRFFAYLNLFIFSMLVLILGDSLPALFIGWEGVGLCSYLLIGFWFEDEKNAAAGKKAFIANRVGDFGLLVAMGLLLFYTKALDWQGIEAGRNQLLHAVVILPSDLFGLHVMKEPVQVSAATLVGLALFLGCAGKSAQIPLYVWLPDAMAGPTPVSALIHAATMVTAGVYLVCRLSMVFVLSPAAMLTIAVVGALTALLAASIAFAQTDIKKVLAYSTVSQLGYMFLGVGVGAFTAGFFHVITHAFFKACLFLGAGSVIHAMHARIHDSDKSQDMRLMGGLKQYLPYTYWTFAFAWAAIVGFPLTSGFFSKDAILLAAKTSSITLPQENIGGVNNTVVKLFAWPETAGTWLYALGLAGAVMTAFYMTRLFIGIFFGDFKGWKVVKKWKDPGHGHHDDHHHHDEGKPLDGPEPHESPFQMWVPLAILGGLSLVAGFLNAHPFHLHSFDEWLAPVFQTAKGLVKVEEPASEVPYIGAAVAAFVAGVGGAYWVYVMQKGEPARAFTERVPGFYALVRDKWRVDEFYEETFVGAVDALAEGATWFDKWIVDGFFGRFTAFVVSVVGTLLRYLQVGRVQVYSLAMVLGLGGIGWYFFAPRAEAKVTSNEATGAYSVSVTPGLGYTFRWDENGDGKWEGKGFGDKTEVSFELKPAQTRKVRLEAKNAFGRIVEKELTVERPKLDLSRMTPDEAAAAASGRPQAPAPMPKVHP